MAIHFRQAPRTGTKARTRRADRLLEASYRSNATLANGPERAKNLVNWKEVSLIRIVGGAILFLVSDADRPARTDLQDNGKLRREGVEKQGRQENMISNFR
jgi:hypothetical protein